MLLPVGGCLTLCRALQLRLLQFDVFSRSSSIVLARTFVIHRDGLMSSPTVTALSNRYLLDPFLSCLACPRKSHTYFSFAQSLDLGGELAMFTIPSLICLSLGQGDNAIK